MKAELKKNSLNQVVEGTEVFCEGDPVTDIGLIIKGRVRVRADGINLVVGTGSFLGICDLETKFHQVTYIAETALAVYTFPALSLPSVIGILVKNNKDYAPLLVSNLCKYIRDVSKIYEDLKDGCQATAKFLKSAYRTYGELGKELGTKTNTLSVIENLSTASEEDSVDMRLLDYYRACAGISTNVQKAYFSSSLVITLYHIQEQIQLTSNLIACCKQYADELRGMVQPLILDDRSLYMSILQQANTLQRAGMDIKKVSALFDDVIDRINTIENLMIDEAGIDLEIDHEFMEDAYFELMSGKSEQADEGKETGADFSVNLSEYAGALDTILEYAEFGEREAFKGFVMDFLHLPDKFATDDDTRTLRRNIMKLYYPLYKSVFLKDYESKEPAPPVIDLFLRYGFLSEKLISDQMLKELLAIEKSAAKVGDCAVYDMKEWLTLIISGEKEPSKSEFDLDYDENLRELRKTGHITAERQQQLSNDKMEKFDYELQNMFKSNHRLVFGQVSVFVPFLFSDACVNSLERSYLSAEKVNVVVHKLKQIDFSVFYRETLYGKEGVFIKEYIEEEVFPDFILMPCYGSKGVMWQELSGRRKNSKGRLLLPVFMESELEPEMIKLFGRFRWELCRTMQGAAWNNIQIKSLTSEYSDFLQFYRKNRELSDEKKDKVKMQIQKSRNNTREVFVIDYENWMKHEAKGGLVLNKPVRAILATYCPFSKEIREKLGEQPMFRDAMAKFDRERAKKVKEYDMKFKVWEKDQREIPQEVIETKRFYTEM